MGALMDTAALSPLQTLRAIAAWMKSKDEDDFAGVKAAAEEAAENALKKIKARITRLKNEAKKQGGLADKVGVLQKIQDAERLQRTMRNEIFAVEDAIKAALSQKDASVMRDFSSTFPEAVAIVEKALSGVGGATAPEQSPATSENFIGADIYHEFFVENEYGSPGYDDGFHTIRKSAQPGTTVLEKIIRPSGKYIYVLYLIEADGYGQEVVNPGDQLFEVVKKIKEKYEAKQTQKQLVQEKRQKVDKTNQRVAQDEGFFVGKKIGSLYFNDGKKLKNAVIVGAKPNGIFDIEGTAGNRRMVAKGVEAEALLKAIDRAQGYDHSITPLGVQTTIGNAIQGRPNPVKTAKGTRVATVLALVEADSLIVSHDPASGNENPAFPQELQPRDRGRDSSIQWVQKVAASLDPDSLGRTSRADTGAPIIGPDHVVESGNGRSMAVKLAYQRGTADDYRQWLVDEAGYFGFTPEQVEAMRQPVLVRLRTSDIDRKAFVVEANQDDKLTFTATERAKTDAKRLDSHLLGLFAPSEDGDVTAASNQRFVQGFLQSLGDAEAAQYLTKDGKPTVALVHRLRAAVFSKAYNDDRLLEMMADQTKPEIQNVLNALSAAAPRFIDAQGYSRAGTEDVASGLVDGIEQSLDKRVVDAIVQATNTLMAARGQQQDVAEYVKQLGMFEELPEGVPELAVFLAQNSRSAKKMAIAFKAMAEFVKQDAISQQSDNLFGDPEPPRMADVVAAANAAIEREYGPEDGGMIGLFDSASMTPLQTLKAIAAWANSRNTPALTLWNQLEQENKGWSLTLKDAAREGYIITGRFDEDGTPQGMFALKGPDGKMIQTIGQGDLIKQVLQAFKRQYGKELLTALQGIGVLPKAGEALIIHDQAEAATYFDKHYASQKNAHDFIEFLKANHNTIKQGIHQRLDAAKENFRNIKLGRVAIHPSNAQMALQLAQGEEDKWRSYLAAIRDFEAQIEAQDQDGQPERSQQDKISDLNAKIQALKEEGKAASAELRSLQGDEKAKAMQAAFEDFHQRNSEINDLLLQLLEAKKGIDDFSDAPDVPVILNESGWESLAISQVRIARSFLKWLQKNNAQSPSVITRKLNEQGQPFAIGWKNESRQTDYSLKFLGVPRQYPYAMAIAAPSAEDSWEGLLAKLQNLANVPESEVDQYPRSVFDAIEGGVWDSTRMDSLADPDQTVYAVQQVPTDLISTDPGAYQWRDNTDDDGTEDRPIDPYETWDEDTPPLILHRRNDSTLWVVDGHHRLAKAERLDVPEVPAVILDEDDGYTVAAMRALCAMLNLTNEASEADGASYDPVILAGTAKHLMAMQ